MEVVYFSLTPYQWVAGIIFIVLMLSIIFFPGVILWPVTTLKKYVRRRLSKGDNNHAAE